MQHEKNIALPSRLLRIHKSKLAPLVWLAKTRPNVENKSANAESIFGIPGFKINASIGAIPTSSQLFSQHCRSVLTGLKQRAPNVLRNSRDILGLRTSLAMMSPMTPDIFILKNESINNNKLQLSSSLQKNVATFFPRNNLLHDVVEINNWKRILSNSKNKFVKLRCRLLLI